MKTSLKTLLATTFAAIILTSSAAVSVANENNSNNNNGNHNVTTLSSVKNISKIVVSGNVKVLLVQDKNESVKVYDNYYAKNAVVQQQGSVLNISSFADQKLTVVVYVNNLSSIEASNNSSVATFGKFDLLSLQVNLKDNATADINSSTVCLYTSVKNDAVLKLSGSTATHTGVISSLAKLNMDQFSAADSSITSIVPATINTAKRQMLKDMVIAGDIAFLSPIK